MSEDAPPSIRYFSERDHTFGPPRDQGYAVGPNGEPIVLPRDTRMWLSVEEAAARGWAVPDNWRELP